MRAFSNWFVPGGLALFGAVWFGGLGLAGFPGDGFAERLDLALSSWLAANRSAQMVHAFGWITALGNAKLVLLLALGLSIFLWRAGVRAQIAPLWLVPIGASLTTVALKLAFGRPRPDGALRSLSDFSFPSGHATGAVAFFGFVAWLAAYNRWISPGVALFLGGVLVVLIGFSRLYLGVHYLSDVANGYLVGALWMAGGIWWIRRADSG